MTGLVITSPPAPSPSPPRVVVCSAAKGQPGADRRGVYAAREVVAEVRNFAGEVRSVLLGVTGRLEFVDAPGHVADAARYCAPCYAMTGNRIRLVTDRPMDAVEVRPALVNRVEMASVTVEYRPPRPALG